jgi:hypothetical protein
MEPRTRSTPPAQIRPSSKPFSTRQRIRHAWLKPPGRQGPSADGAGFRAGEGRETGATHQFIGTCSRVIFNKSSPWNLACQVPNLKFFRATGISGHPTPPPTPARPPLPTAGLRHAVAFYPDTRKTGRRARAGNAFFLNLFPAPRPARHGLWAGQQRRRRRRIRWLNGTPASLRAYPKEGTVPFRKRDRPLFWIGSSPATVAACTLALSRITSTARSAVPGNAPAPVEVLPWRPPPRAPQGVYVTSSPC